ncbi:hypothetical protein QYE76_070786 [Lolium multiflorum]|uniref:Retrotransposon gag domain-containing protein n=1 Tax=Lolium multiflorum TaxID=4521 RepID=A0AAD8WDY7_LOLMU|nr:hypothetical protein QYE76_070786 [Lolium multiflorum]
MSASDHKIVTQENKSVADIITWREYEALRNEMRREFHAQDEVLNGKIDEISQKLDATHVTVTTVQDQMTDVQRNLSDLRLAVENLTAQQQQEDDDDPELQDDAHNARDVPRGGADVEEYITWELKIEKLWSLHPHYTEDRKMKLASSEFDGYALRLRDAFVRNREEDREQPIRTWHAMKEAMTSRFVPTNYLRNIYDKLTLLRQGVKTVDEYYMEMEMLMQRGRVRESLEMTMQRFLNGLKYDIKGIVRHYSYTDMNQLLHHAREAESQLADKAKIKGRATGAGRYTPRAAPSTAPAPSMRSAPYSIPPSKPVSNVSNTKKSESAASTSGSNVSTARNRDMACHTCGGKGHFKRDYPNRKVMIINEDNEYETGDDVDPNAPEDDEYDTDGEDAYSSDARTIVVSQRALNVLPSASTQRCNLFQTKALVGPDKACKVIIGGSCRNLANKELCTKLKLKYLPHPHPHYIQWLSDNGEMKVNHMVRVEFAIGPITSGGLMGHFGREKTLLMLADHFYWPKMRRDVDRSGHPLSTPFSTTSTALVTRTPLRNDEPPRRWPPLAPPPPPSPPLDSQFDITASAQEEWRRGAELWRAKRWQRREAFEQRARQRREAAAATAEEDPAAEENAAWEEALADTIVAFDAATAALDGGDWPAVV